MMILAIDSSVWVEYFKGNELTKELIETDKLVTSSIAIAELATLFDKHNKNFKKELQFIKSRCKIIPLTVEIALLAAKIKNEQRAKKEKFGLADAMHYATARTSNAELVTTDHDFAGMEKVRMLKG